MSNETARRFRRKLTGEVVSNKSSKTIVVEVVRRYKHAKYRKFVHATKKYHAHDEKELAKQGDVVTIVESRPFSKLKRWELLFPQKG